MKNIVILTAAVFALVILPASAKHKDRGVRDELTRTECGACHMVFQPRFLPAISWSTMMSGLANHFGEDASIDDVSKTKILAYLVKNARKKKFKTRNGKQPLRISQLRCFVSEHRGEVSKRSLAKAGTLANCASCHQGADRGQYDDD